MKFHRAAIKIVSELCYKMFSERGDILVVGVFFFKVHHQYADIFLFLCVHRGNFSLFDKATVEVC